MKNSNINKYNRLLGLAALALLATSAGCGQELSAGNGSLGEDFEGEVEVDPENPQPLPGSRECWSVKCIVHDNDVSLSAASQENGVFPVQLADFEGMPGGPGNHIVRTKGDTKGTDFVFVEPGSDGQQGKLTVKVERRDGTTLPVEFVDEFDVFVRAQANDKDLDNGVTMRNLNFWFQGDLTLAVVDNNSLEATNYQIDNIGFAQQHIGSKNVWWIGIVSDHLRGENRERDEGIRIEESLFIEAVNPEDPSDRLTIQFTPRSGSSFEFDLTVAPSPTPPPPAPGRFFDNRDGTVFDTELGLVWERKAPAMDVSPLEAGNLHGSDAIATGEWLNKLNNTCNDDHTVDCTVGGEADCADAGVGGSCGFAGGRTWRLPEVDADGGTAELDTLFDISQCAELDETTCISPLFGTTSTNPYWSSITRDNDSSKAWTFLFQEPFYLATYAFPKSRPEVLVRAVRDFNGPIPPAPGNGFIRQDASGDEVYTITLDEPSSVQLFVRETGDFAPFLVTSGLDEVANPDGTFTYSLTDSGDHYEEGIEIEARFAVFSSQTGQQFIPGPDDSVWSEPFLVSEAL